MRARLSYRFTAGGGGRFPHACLKCVGIGSYFSDSTYRANLSYVLKQDVIRSESFYPSGTLESNPTLHYAFLRIQGWRITPLRTACLLWTSGCRRRCIPRWPDPELPPYFQNRPGTKSEWRERPTAPGTVRVPLARMRSARRLSLRSLPAAFGRRSICLPYRQGSRPCSDCRWHCAICWPSWARRARRRLGACGPAPGRPRTSSVFYYSCLCRPCRVLYRLWNASGRAESRSWRFVHLFTLWQSILLFEKTFPN